MKKSYTILLWIVFICIIPLVYSVLKSLLQDKDIKFIELAMTFVPYIFGILTMMYRIDIKFYFFIQRILQQFKNNYTSWILSVRYENIYDDDNLLSNLQSLLSNEDCKMIKSDNTFLSVLWNSRHIVNLRLENMDNELSLHFYTTKMDVPIKSNTKKIKSLSHILDLIENTINMIDRNLKKYELDIFYPDASPYYSYWVKSLPEERIIKFSCSIAIDENDDVVDVNKNRLRICADTLHSLFSKVNMYLTLRGELSMNSYKLVAVKQFPQITTGSQRITVVNGTLPGFTRNPKTEILFINSDYHGFEYYEFEHEMIFKENGIAFGFIEGEPKMLDFNDYLKKFTIKCFLNRKDKYAYLSASSAVVHDLLKIIAKNDDLKTEIEEFSLDMQNLKLHVDDYLGAWFKKVSTRVSASALFGSDLVNEPLYQQLITDGAVLTSVFIPYNGMTIQLNDKAGISSKQNFEDIQSELDLIQSLKSEVIDKIISS